MPILWGYILEGPGRPSRADQEKSLAILGVDPGQTWHDKLAGRTSTRPRNKLEGRNGLIASALSGDTAYVAAPECAGVSAADVRWFLDQMTAQGVRVVINGEMLVAEPGDDVQPILDAVARWQNRKNVAAWRAKKAKKRKSQ